MRLISRYSVRFVKFRRILDLVSASLDDAKSVQKMLIKKIRRASLKIVYLHEFLVFFQKSGSYVELRTRIIYFRRGNTASVNRGSRQIQDPAIFHETNVSSKKKHNYNIITVLDVGAVIG